MTKIISQNSPLPISSAANLPLPSDEIDLEFEIPSSSTQQLKKYDPRENVSAAEQKSSASAQSASSAAAAAESSVYGRRCLATTVSLKERLKAQMISKIINAPAPKLSGGAQTFVELETTSDDDDQLTASFVNPLIRAQMAKHFRAEREAKQRKLPQPENNPKTLQQWKADIERKMKVKRDEGIAERERLYRMEREEFDQQHKLDADDSDADEQNEEVGVDDSEEDQSEAEDSEEDQSEPENEANAEKRATEKGFNAEKCAETEEEDFEAKESAKLKTGSPEVPETIIERVEIEEKMQDEQTPVKNRKSMIHNIADFVKMEDSRKTTEDSQPSLIAAEDSQQSLITAEESQQPMVEDSQRPFLNDDEEDPLPCTSSYGDMFASYPSTSSANHPQRNSAAFFDDENATDCFPTEIRLRMQVELGMDKNMTSQEAEAEVLNLLTNPFGVAEDSSSYVLKSWKSQATQKSHQSQVARQNSLLEVGDSSDSDSQPIKAGFRKRRRILENILDEETRLSDDNGGLRAEEKDRGAVQCVEESNDGAEKFDNNNAELVDDEAEEFADNAEDSNKEVAESEDEEYADENEEEDDEEMALARSLNEKKKFFVDLNTRKIRREFVEGEAELSGSEADSDEDEEIGSDDDNMEMEEGDFDDLPSDDELRAQIGKIHHKQMLDDDKRKLLMYKDAYLPDGEMHVDDFVRRFRWRKNEENGENFNENAPNTEDNIDDDDEEPQKVVTLTNTEPHFDDEEENNDQKLFTFKKINVRRSISIFSQNSYITSSQDDDHDSLLMYSEQSVNFRQRESLLHRQPSILSKIAFENGNSNGPSASSTTTGFPTNTKTLFLSSDQSQSIDQDSCVGAGKQKQFSKLKKRKNPTDEKNSTATKKRTNFSQIIGSGGSIFESLYN